MTNEYDRFMGTIAGMMCGDAVGAQVEFKSVHDIKQFFSSCKDRHLCMCGGGTFNLEPGQVTDDSEMAFSLGNAIIEGEGVYSQKVAKDHYVIWATSKPFDMGMATQQALLQNNPRIDSQANGALMRVSPLAAFYRKSSFAEIAKLASADCSITHPHEVCRSCNELYCLAIARLINGMPVMEMFKWLCEYAKAMNYPQEIIDVLVRSKYAMPAVYTNKIGWVLIAFQNAFFRLINESSFDDIIQKTIFSGGDTDTNAAIAGALAGAYYGMSNIPEDWINTLMNCKPKRPEIFHPKAGFDMAQTLWEMSNWEMSN